MITKTQQMVDALSKGDTKTALKVAKSFKIGLTKEQQAQIARGYECITNARYYSQLGFDPLVETEKAVQLIAFFRK